MTTLVVAPHSSFRFVDDTGEMGQSLQNDVERGVSAVLASLTAEAGDPLRHLTEAHWPPAPDTRVAADTHLYDLLSAWAARSPLPVVVFFDEIDALFDDVLISVPRQLRAGYTRRPGHFPQSVALIGLRDVRDYKASLRGESETMGTSSPFNVKVESLTIRNFNEPEVAELYAQHTAETGQAFTEEALALAFHLSLGFANGGLVHKLVT